MLNQYQAAGFSLSATKTKLDVSLEQVDELTPKTPQFTRDGPGMSLAPDSVLLNTMLTFKTQKCEDVAHYQSNDDWNIVRDSCHFYHGAYDRRRQIMSDLALQKFSSDQPLPPDGQAMGTPTKSSFTSSSSPSHTKQASDHLRREGESVLLSDEVGTSNFGAAGASAILQNALQLALSNQSKLYFDSMVRYSAELCHAFSHASAGEQEKCPLSHNRFERSFHPLLYLTQQCVHVEHIQLHKQQEREREFGANFRIESCPSFHSESERRFLPQFIAPRQNPYFVPSGHSSINLTSPPEDLLTGVGRYSNAKQGGPPSPLGLSGTKENHPVAFQNLLMPQQQAQMQLQSQMGLHVQNLLLKVQQSQIELTHLQQQMQLHDRNPFVEDLLALELQKMKDLVAIQSQLEENQYQRSHDQNSTGMQNPILTYIGSERGAQLSPKPEKGNRKTSMRTQNEDFLRVNSLDINQAQFVRIPSHNDAQINRFSGQTESTGHQSRGFVRDNDQGGLSGQSITDGGLDFDKNLLMSSLRSNEIVAPSNLSDQLGRQASGASFQMSQHSGTSGHYKNEKSQNISSESKVKPGKQNKQSKNQHYSKGGKNNDIFYFFNTEREASGHSSNLSTSSGSSRHIRHLDLDKFKVEACTMTNQHNHKHCRYYHSDIDRRRKNRDYSPDLCANQDRNDRNSNNNGNSTCQANVECGFAHNKVERLYHVEKYKTKYCTKTPEQCDYREYCSFAHSQRDIKTRLIDRMQRSMVFYMFYFKTEWCPFNTEHNKAQCVYAHNWQDFRRKPHLFDYDARQLCENWQAGNFIGKYQEGCPLQAFCAKSHGWKEQVYHPFNYKVKPCEERQCLQGLDCAFYHQSANDRRIFKSFKEVMQRIEGPSKPPVTLTEAELKTDVKYIVQGNINHLAEFLLNVGVQGWPLSSLAKYFEFKKYPVSLLSFIVDKGVVPDQQMTNLRKVFKQMPRRTRNPKANPTQGGGEWSALGDELTQNRPGVIPKGGMPAPHYPVGITTIPPPSRYKQGELPIPLNTQPVYGRTKTAETLGSHLQPPHSNLFQTPNQAKHAAIMQAYQYAASQQQNNAMQQFVSSQQQPTWQQPHPSHQQYMPFPSNETSGFAHSKSQGYGGEENQDGPYSQQQLYSTALKALQDVNNQSVGEEDNFTTSVFQAFQPAGNEMPQRILESAIEQEIDQFLFDENNEEGPPQSQQSQAQVLPRLNFP